MRIGAVGDLHLAGDTADWLPAELADVAEHADILLLAGDLTQHGLREEGQLLARALRDLDVPVVAVLGNHDYHHGKQDIICRDLAEAGVIVLEGSSAVFDIDGRRLGVAGAKGFGGGFVGACASDFGEPEMKAFVRHTKDVTRRFASCIEALECDVRVALTHYAPCDGTLRGERLEIFPFLGSYLLGEAIDGGDCDLALHGHAHKGTEQAVTPGGVPVRNVARPVIRCPYKVYIVDPAGSQVRDVRPQTC